MNTGWTPEISTEKKIANLTATTGPELAVMAMVQSDGDLFEAERILTGIARNLSHIIGSPIRVSDEQGDKLAAYFCGDPVQAVLHHDELVAEEAAIREKLMNAEEAAEREDLFAQLAAVEKQINISEDIDYAMDDHRDALMRAGLRR